MTGIKKNFFYSSILTTANYIFPLLTFPYVSRVLGVTNIGICNYVDSIINYFCVLSAMGVAVVGVREIARASNKEVRSNTFFSVFAINAAFTFLSIIVLLLCIFFIPNLYQYRQLFYVGVLKLICSLFYVEWFYKGIEDFSYITKRTIIIKIFYVISIFMFVKCPDDYFLYFFITTLLTGLNALINVFHLRGFVVLNRMNISFTPFIKSYLIMGVYTILTTMYTTFNVAILGYISGPTEVGYFTTASKIFSIILALFTAFTGVMLPRMSSLLADNEEERFLSLINKSVDALFIFVFPTIIMFVVFSPEFIYLIGGKGYEGAILPLRIIMPLIFIVGYEQILIIQALMPLKKDKAIFFNSCVGASVGLLFNFLLIPFLGCVGASIAYGICEMSVFFCALFFLRKYINHRLPYKQLFRHIMFNLPLIIICITISLITFPNYIIKLIVAGFCVGLYTYVNNLYLMKNMIFIQIVENLKMQKWMSR